MGWLLFHLLVALMLVFLLAPVILVIPMSFSADRVLAWPPSGFSLRWYAAMLEERGLALAARNSLVLAVMVTVATLAIALPAALALDRWRFAGRDALLALLTAPLLLPTIVLALAVLIIFVSNGLLGTIGAFSKGAPIRVTAASMTGSPDLFWYAQTESNIKSIKDLEGKSMGFSQPGSSTHLVAQSLLQHFKVKANLVPSGSPSGSFTMVMSGQLDAGWTVPPFRLQEIEEGKVNVVVKGSQDPAVENQTTRVYVSTAQTIKAKRDLLVRFHRALANSVAFAYSNDAALEAYATMAKITPAIARRVRDEFHPLPNMQLKEVRGLDISLKQALEFKFIDKPMKPEDFKAMIEILVP